MRVLSRGLPLLLALVALSGLSILLIRGYVEGREGIMRDAQRDLPIKSPPRVSFNSDGQPIIRLELASQERSGLKTELGRQATYSEQVRAYGTVLDLANMTSLNTNYVAAISQLKAAEAKLVASQSASERAQTLHKTDAGSLAQAETAEAVYRSDAASVAAAQSQSRTLAATAIQEWGQTLGTALLQAAPQVQRLIERKDLLIQVTLPPGISIEPPPEAIVRSGRTAPLAQARLVSPAPRTDPKIQGLSFFYLTTADCELLPGMNVIAYLRSGAAVEGIKIPASAIVWNAGKAWAYSKIGADRFTRREIPDGTAAGFVGDVVVPAKGFPSNPEFVTQGAQLLMSEEYRAQIQVGEDPNQ